MGPERVGKPALAAAAFALVAGCGSSSSGDVKAALDDGIAAIRATHDYGELRGKLLATIARLRSTRDGEGRRLAIRGFESMIRGNNSRIAFVENDRGNIEAATRDAKRAGAGLRKGATLLRAAGRLLGRKVGTLNGY